MTPWLTPERAAAAQEWLTRAGAHRCDTCGSRVWRFPTSADADHLRTWSEQDDGSWWLNPSTGIMQPFDPDDEGDVWRFVPHSCIFRCDPDEADQ